MAQQPKVLIIDDEEAARYGMLRALSSLGYVLEEAEDGVVASGKIECRSRKF